MSTYDLIESLPNGIHTRQELFHAILAQSPSFTYSQLPTIINRAMRSNLLVRIGHNRYMKGKESNIKPVFKGRYSSQSHAIIAFMLTAFPALQWRIWELSWLNEFVNHLIAKNTIFVEVESDGCSFVFSALNQKYPGQVLLRPTSEQLSLYGDSKTIVIRRLVSEAPKQSEAPYQVPLEKLIVDLFSNQDLLVSKGDYAYAIEEMFAAYHIDTVAMLRYARRRNREAVIKAFIEHKTMLEPFWGPT